MKSMLQWGLFTYNATKNFKIKHALMLELKLAFSGGLITI